MVYIIDISAQPYRRILEETTRSEFIKQFNVLYQEYYDALKCNCDKFNADNKLKIIGAYSGILFGYCKEIEILLSANWYTSLIPLTRDLVECYATLKKLISCFPIQADFDDYYKYLVFTDILQDKTIYQQLETDKTITDTVKRDQELDNFLARFENLLKKNFPAESIGIDPNNLKVTIFSVIDKINNQRYKNDKTNYPSKSQLVGDMLYQNVAWRKASGGSPYEKSYAIYSTLCHATHNNLSSVEERTINNGYFMLNNQPSHIEAVMSLAYYCALDVKEGFLTILV